MEIWKDVGGYEWLYEVSNLWRVKSLNYMRTWTSRLLAQATNHWYSVVWFYKENKQKNFRVHRLVAIAFKHNPLNKLEVNHLDWNKLNNNDWNLEWSTPSENTQHAHDTWLAVSCFKKNNPAKWMFWKKHHSSKIVYQYSKEWEFIKKWFSLADIKRDTRILNVSACCRWKIKTAWWFKWKYWE